MFLWIMGFLGFVGILAPLGALGFLRLQGFLGFLGAPRDLWGPSARRAPTVFRARRDGRVRIVCRFCAVRSVPSETICGGFVYMPLPRGVGHFPGLPMAPRDPRAPRIPILLSVPRVPRVRTVSRVPGVPRAPRVPRVPMVSRVRMVRRVRMVLRVPNVRSFRIIPSPTICGGFVYLPLPRWALGTFLVFLGS